MITLEKLKEMSVKIGYRFEVDPADGTERMYRPDGTLAVTAKGPPVAPQIAPLKDEVVLPTIASESTAEGWTGLMAVFAPAPTDSSTTNSGDTGGPINSDTK